MSLTSPLPSPRTAPLQRWLPHEPATAQGAPTRPLQSARLARPPRVGAVHGAQSPLGTCIDSCRGRHKRYVCFLPAMKDSLLSAAGGGDRVRRDSKGNLLEDPEAAKEGVPPLRHAPSLPACARVRVQLPPPPLPRATSLCLSCARGLSLCASDGGCVDTQGRRCPQIQRYGSDGSRRRLRRDRRPRAVSAVAHGSARTVLVFQRPCPQEFSVCLQVICARLRDRDFSRGAGRHCDERVRQHAVVRR